MPYIAGARKDTARPVVAYSPKTSPSRPSGIMRPRKDRDADWVGPTKTQRARPKVQKIIFPPLCKKKTLMPAITMQLSEITIRRFGPMMSSKAPMAIVAIPATTFAAIAKIITSPEEKPKAVPARIAPKVNTPARPSLNTAEAARKNRVCGDSFARDFTVLQSFR